MAFNFNANQYDGAFSPQRLLNFEVPAVPKKPYPCARTGSTKVISNERGHIKIETMRSPSSPWGSFVGTWQAERKPIRLMTKTKLRNPYSNTQYIETKGSSNVEETRKASDAAHDLVKLSPEPKLDESVRSESVVSAHSPPPSSSQPTSPMADSQSLFDSHQLK